MTTNDFVSAINLASRDASLSSSRERQKNDGTGFADFLASTPEKTAKIWNTAAQTEPDVRLMQSQMLNSLSQMIDGSNDQALAYKRRNIEAIRKTLEMTAGTYADDGDSGVAQKSRSRTNLFVKDSGRKGIPLQRGNKGIPLVMPPGVHSDTVQNVALNRNRPDRISRKKTRRSRQDTIKSALLSSEIGDLAARFESGRDGIAAIGYDRYGGTSYGKYQIASRPGSMRLFLNFLDKEAPDLGKRLRDAGSANTGSRRGEMPTVWKEIAASEPERFGELQERFIRESHYEPALSSLQKMGFDTENFSAAMQKVLWSTAVQHGPAGAARIFREAAEQTGSTNASEQVLIPKIYALRAECFTSSSAEIRAAARQRMQTEKSIALAMLSDRKARA